MLDFRVDTFLAACKYLNFTKAANELNITQPAVTQHIRCLETEFCTKLFNSKGKRMCLTEAGELLKSTAITMKHDEIHLKDKLGELKSQRKILNIGATRTAGEFILPEKIAAYLIRYPNVKLKLYVENTKELLVNMNEGFIDCALIEGFFDKSEYDSLKYSREPYIAVCHPALVSECRFKAVEDLFEKRLIIREEGSGTREILERYLESCNLSIKEFKKITEIGDIQAIKTLVKKGLGVTFLYKAAVEKELVEGSLRKIPLEEFELSHDMTFVWRKGSIFAGYYKDLFAELKK